VFKSVTQIDTKTNVITNDSKKISSGLTSLLNANLKKDLLVKQNEYRNRNKTDDLYQEVQTRYELKKDQKVIFC
jgi:hypothetical protein